MSGQSLRNDGSGRNARRAAATWDLELACSLVNRAARGAPPALAQRLEEEWLADLDGRQGAFSRIRFALGCCWATRVIAREFGAVAAAAASSAAGERLLVGHGGHDFSLLSRRTVALIAIVFLHVGILYLYLTGVGAAPVVPRPSPMTGIITNETSRRQPPTPLPPVKLSRVAASRLLTPDLKFNLPVDPHVITAPHSTEPIAPPVSPVHSKQVDRVIGGPGTGFPDTEEFYPPAARRLGEAGITVVSVCVDPRGRLTAAPALVESSGIRMIDEGALRLAGAGSGHYRPTTENGRPVSSCYAFRIRFQLEDQ